MRRHIRHLEPERILRIFRILKNYDAAEIAFLESLVATAGVKYETLRTPEKNSKGRKVFSLGFHSLRHSCTSLMANIGVSQEIRKKLVGHKSNVHERYTHFENETYRKALKDFPTLL